MIHHFPLFAVANTLSHHDFRNFFLPFSRKIKEKFTTVCDIFFLEDAGQLASLASAGSNLDRLQENFSQAIASKLPVAHDDYLLFSWPVNGEQTIVALVTGVDRLLVKKVGLDWLQETGATLQREFLIIKQAGVDLQTGLLNGAHLHALFDMFPENEHVGLVLVEVYPKVRTALEAMQHVRHSAAVLKSFLGEHIPLYHIGQSVFAFSCRQCNDDFAARFGPLLISYLKREQFKCIHIGFSQGQISRCRQNDTRQILDESWQALQIACKRGPFSFCTYRSLQNFQRHPLYTSNQNLLARLHPCWQQLEQFALILLHTADPLENIYDHIILDMVDSKKFKGPDNDVYLLLPIADAKKVKSIVKKIILFVNRDQKVSTPVAAGITTYPFADFKKSESVLNCRKALLHGALLGEGMITIFDALSLNVSGDIFYGEGDIPKAVKDYRRGLIIQPEDVNLLNSLGVCYAMMNKHRLANDCFVKALTVKNDDFMSWYNLGLGRQMQGNIAGAVESFEQACQCHIANEQYIKDVRSELTLQLGKLYCQTGRYQETLDLLVPWHENNISLPGTGRALRYIGESFHGLGRDRAAMIWLQRAIRFDEFDADALSLLGEVYLDNHEGDQIALKLCEKSIELNPKPPVFYLRLAKAQLQCGFPEEAKNTLRHHLKNKAIKGAAGFQMGLIYKRQGQQMKARQWFSKTIKYEQSGSNWHQQASSYMT